jgi:hypothetical protein
MLRSCIICRVEESLDLQLLYCSVCQSASYCSKSCQRKDWRKQHKQICKLLNVGHGDMQVRTPIHTSRSLDLYEACISAERVLDADGKLFFEIFEHSDSTFEESRTEARKMRKIVKRQTKHTQKCLLFHSLFYLIRAHSQFLSRLDSPLLVLLQFVDPNVLAESRLQEDPAMVTPLYDLANLADPRANFTHEIQLILARQLIEHGANVNAVLSPNGQTPLHNACHSRNVTNLDFIELLLKEGADLNAQDHLGLTPLMCTTPDAPGAAKFLLNWPTTDVNLTNRSGGSFLALVRSTITDFSDKVARLGSLNRVKDQFLLQQWRGIEEILVEREAADASITNLE